MTRRLPVVLALVAVGVLFAYPFWWLVSASLKDRSQEAREKFVASCQKYLTGHEGTV